MIYATHEEGTDGVNITVEFHSLYITRLPLCSIVKCRSRDHDLVNTSSIHCQCGSVPTPCPVCVQCLPDSETRGLLSPPCWRATSSPPRRNTVSEVRTNHCIAVFGFYQHIHSIIVHQNSIQHTALSHQKKATFAGRKYSRSVLFTAFSAFDVLGSFQNHFYAHLSTRNDEVFVRFSSKSITIISGKMSRHRRTKQLTAESSN